jgi:hypothetical protein
MWKHQKEENRGECNIDEVISFIKEAKPDAFGINEAMGEQWNGNLAKIASETGYAFAFGEAQNGVLWS